MDNNDISNKNGQYRAVSNLNTAIENPEFTVNNTMGVNIENANQDVLVNGNDVNQNSMLNNNFVENNNVYQSNMIPNQGEFLNNSNGIASPFDTNMSNSSFVSNNNQNSGVTQSSFIPTNINNNVDNSSVSVVSYEPISNEYNYEPVMENNKKNSKFTIPKELKLMIFLIFVLAIFVILMPYIYDFFKDLGFVITDGK